MPNRRDSWARCCFVLATALLFSATGLFAQNRPDLSGTWVLAQMSSGGSESDQGWFGHQCTINQDASTLRVEFSVQGAVIYVFNFDGAEHPLTQGAPREFPQSMKYMLSDGTPLTSMPEDVARASWDAGTLVIDSKRVTNILGSFQTLTLSQVSSKWRLSIEADGSLAIRIASTFEGKAVPASTYIYKRRPALWWPLRR